MLSVLSKSVGKKVASATLSFFATLYLTCSAFIEVPISTGVKRGLTKSIRVNFQIDIYKQKEQKQQFERAQQSHNFFDN